MTKLLQIAVEGNIGSTGTIAEAIGKLVMEKGWESYIAHGRFPRPSKSQTIRIGSDVDVLLHVVETRLFDRHGLGSVQATKKLVRQIKSIQPDIIHMHHLHGYYINIKILFDYLAEANKPVVWTFHDCWSVTGHCCHFDFVGCKKWKSGCFECPQLREYPATLFYDRTRQNYELKKNLFTSVPNMVIVSVSKWLDEVVASSFLKETAHQVIYNGIDVNVFKPVENREEIRNRYGFGNDFIILGVAGVWGNRKGFDDFLKLSMNLKDDERVVLVGLSEQQIKLLPENITGLKKTENLTELVDLYNAADVFMSLSVEETFGLASAEALACGTPAIVYHATACPEIIDANTGITVEKKDFEGLASAISNIKTKGRKTYSSNCRERAVAKFNKNERFMEYLELYNKLLLNKSQA